MNYGMVGLILIPSIHGLADKSGNKSSGMSRNGRVSRRFGVKQVSRAGGEAVL